MSFLTRFISDIPSMVLSLPVILFALSFHEMSHAFVAYKLGDPSARNLGRLTLNPTKHIDPIGFLCMVLFRFGWAKPVPINSRNFRNPRRGMALSGLAGPVSNVILAIGNTVLLRVALALCVRFFPEDLNAVAKNILFGTDLTVGTPFMIAAILVMMLYLGVIINLSYALFNLIPLPPLDGSRIFYIFLPPKWYFGVMKYERYIQIAMLIALWTGILTLPLSGAVSGITDGLFFLSGISRDDSIYSALICISNYISSFL